MIKIGTLVSLNFTGGVYKDIIGDGSLTGLVIGNSFDQEGQHISDDIFLIVLVDSPPLDRMNHIQALTHVTAFVNYSSVKFTNILTPLPKNYKYGNAVVVSKALFTVLSTKINSIIKLHYVYK